MDADRFDALSRSLVITRSRRGLARLLCGLSLGGVLSVLGSDSVSAALLNGGARCTKGSQCKTGRCLKPSPCDCRTKSCRCTCACSTTNPVVRCITPSNPCKKAVCRDTGRCVLRNKCTKQAPSTCGRTGECTNGTCLKYGTTTECGERSCSGGLLVRRFCDGAGQCGTGVTEECPAGQQCIGSSCQEPVGGGCEGPGDCDDGIACTDDSCDQTGTCVNAANDANCPFAGQVCDPEQGGCVCPGSKVLCGGSCVTEGDSCATGDQGICATGTLQCDTANDALVCVNDVEPGSRQEICGNGFDDDCDGVTDEADCVAQ